MQQGNKYTREIINRQENNEAQEENLAKTYETDENFDNKPAKHEMKELCQSDVETKGCWKYPNKRDTRQGG